MLTILLRKSRRFNDLLMFQYFREFLSGRERQPVPFGLDVCPRLVGLGSLPVLACPKTPRGESRQPSVAMLGVVQREDWQVEDLHVAHGGHPRF